MNNFEEVFRKITRDPNYLRNLDWGEPRPGHPEGTVKAHIEELERNLMSLSRDTSSEEFWKLRILIHVHDSFKAEANPKAAITETDSHASLARDFLRTYCDHEDLLNMVQFHDEPYALWRQAKHKGDCNKERLSRLLSNIKDWTLFLRFNVVDGVTTGKSSEPLEWTIGRIAPALGLEALAREALDLVKSGKNSGGRDKAVPSGAES